MPKLINLVHPYEFEKIRSINDFLVFTKNAFRIIQKKGCWEKKDGILIPIRWSRDYNSWIVDRGTGLQRDTSGITLFNVGNYYDKSDPIYTAIVSTLKSVESSNDFNIIANNYGLLKNSVKFIPFEYVDKDLIYPLGVYNFCQTKKRKGIVCKCRQMSKIFSNDLETIKSLSSASNNFKETKRYKINKSYLEVQREFINSLKNVTMCFSDELGNEYNINLKKVITENTRLMSVKKNLKDLRNTINSGKVLSVQHFNDTREDLIFFILTKHFGDFVKNMFDKEIEGVIFVDDMTSTQFKLTGSKILEEKYSFKSIKKDEPEKDNSYLLLPKVY